MTISGVSYTSVGSGTLTASTSASTITVTPSANVVAGDLVVVGAYVAGDVTQARDAGDGWVFLDRGYDSVNTYGMLLAVTVAAKAGSGGYAGITLPSAVAFTCQPSSFRCPPGYHWDLARISGSQCLSGWFNATASSTTITPPAIQMPYEQCIDIYICGYNNGGTTTTANPATNYFERNDTGQTSPPHGIQTVDRNAIINGWRTMGTLAGASLAVAKTKRGVVRGMVGIVTNGMEGTRNRYGVYRRIW